MPDREVTTIRDIFYYQYAKLIARRAMGPEAKRANYGFIKATFRKLRDGQMAWSEITREDWQLVEAEKVCAYCGAAGELAREHIVPRSLRVKPECATCPAIQEIHNQVWACAACNRAKGTQGVYGFFRTRHPDDRKFYDRVPRLVEGKYLKTLFECHACAGTLDAADLDGDGEVTVMDIDRVVAQHAP